MSFEFTSLAEVKQIRKSSYGNSLIETISLTLQNQGSVEEVQKLLDDLLYKINHDQDSSDKGFSKEKADVKEKIDALAKESEGLRLQTSEAKKKKAKLSKRIEKAKKKVKEYEKQRAEDKHEIKELLDRREKDHAEYKVSVNDHNDVINAIDAVLFELRKINNKLNGVNKQEERLNKEVKEKERKEKEKEEKKEEKKEKKKDKKPLSKKLQLEKLLMENSFLQKLSGSDNNPETNLFVQLATSKEEKAMVKLINLLTRLQESAKKSLNDDEKYEAKSIKTYNNIKTSVQGDIDKLSGLIHELKKEIKEKESKVKKLESKIKQLDTLSKSKENELSSNKKEENDIDNQYKAEKEQRKTEKKTVLKLQRVVEKRVESMSKFLKEKTE